MSDFEQPLVLRLLWGGGDIRHNFSLQENETGDIVVSDIDYVDYVKKICMHMGGLDFTVEVKCVMFLKDKKLSSHNASVRKVLSNSNKSFNPLLTKLRLKERVSSLAKCLHNN